ncbi:citramalate synthase [Natronogracilivirga saccharolytica]|uniref:Citramalate synthase n=1 Tax=Natronogracilivirga saccharolytica TaxID=2812953 RepID=A0A8J7RIZ2_9BACT|nr:citramalate synthase [Natronogracilivirga saccharolytica]MBP3192640.1 citramalate synthase [Natronogracilivirga saccharolytica]
METRTIDLFDTTLRDGTQGEGISLSSEDKMRIARRLDQAGIDYIEGGWPGSNPKDLDFFTKARDHRFDHARLVAFGSTMRYGNTPEKDPNLMALVEAGTPAVSIFGKTWLFHVHQALGITDRDNLDLIRQSVAFMTAHDKEVVYDAEHFFDGYKDNPDYALQTLQQAAQAGASALVLCDTNGGTLPQEVSEIVRTVIGRFPDTVIGIHAHNDGELAVANTLAAVESGCRHVQGTINGYGERCGNVNLCSVIPNLQLKMGYDCIDPDKMAKVTSLSHYVSEVANVMPFDHQAFVGKSAFAHKGGIHVSAVMKNPSTYEHIEPETVGNKRRVLVSDLSGKSNIHYKSDELGIDLLSYGDKVPEIVGALKDLENQGFQYEAAEGSLDLLIRKITGEWQDLFELKGFRVIIEKNERAEVRSEATIRLLVNGEEEHTAADGNGPVHALDAALRKAICKFYPEVDQMQLSDYKVRVLNEKDGTGAKVRVLIDSQNNGTSWGTVGVSENIIEASWQALMESMAYYLQQQKITTENHS